MQREPTILSGWAEIAEFLRVTERTARRWADEEGAPIRRKPYIMTTREALIWWVKPESNRMTTCPQLPLPAQVEISRWPRRHAPKLRTKQEIRRLLCDNLRARLSRAIRGTQKVGSAIGDLGCTIAELKMHLEHLFQPGMTWANYGYGKGRWSIDHIFPLSRAKLTDREEFQRVCHFRNLQPLWWSDNCRKGAKVPRGRRPANHPMSMCRIERRQRID